MKTPYMPMLGLGILIVGAGASCVSRPAGTPGVALASNNGALADGTAPKPENDMKAPMMIREAKLPEGFPPPGPVGEVILKHYPAYRAARTTAPAGKDDASGAMFRPLFGHIKKNHIAMSAPVEMTYSESALGNAPESEEKPVAMAFLYGAPDLGTPARDGVVDVVDLPAEAVLSVAVRGGYESAYAKGLGQLKAYLAENPGCFEVAGPPRLLGYNSPFVPWFLRVSEVQIPVRAK